MKVLLTGASSFTGMWFARELARRGHEVVVTFRGAAEDYGGLRGERVRRTLEHCRAEHGVSFGDDRFLELCRDGGFDLLCHHAADVTDYRSPDFDLDAALANNTRSLRTVLANLRESGCGRVLLTGSVFENDEGEGGDGDAMHAFSPYGLSKGLTWQVFRLRCYEAGLHLGKFVIPNPFGPWEEPRFCSYLLRTWYAGETAGVKTPAYERDNIHVSLLARSYGAFAESLPQDPGITRLNPSGYRETQGAFATRFAEALRPRLGLVCGLELADQTEFPEPRVRLNTDPVDGAGLGWDETEAWDELADYYRMAFGG